MNRYKLVIVAVMALVLFSVSLYGYTQAQTDSRTDRLATRLEQREALIDAIRSRRNSAFLNLQASNPTMFTLILDTLIVSGDISIQRAESVGWERP